MTKYIVAQSGTVINIVNAPPGNSSATFYWAVDDAQAVNVGDAFDPRNFQYDSADLVAGKILFDHENRIRDLVRAIRAINSTTTGAAAATAAGVPSTAASGDVTGAQFKTAVIGLLPAVSSVAPPSYYIP